MNLKTLWTNRKVRYSLLALLLAAGGLTWYFTTSREQSLDIFTNAEEGPFAVTLTVSGELEALYSEDITAPSSEMRSRHIRINDVTIKYLVPEGTVLDSGDIVAQLDRDALSSLIKTAEDEAEQAQQKVVQARMDTTLTLRDLRNNLINLGYDVEERKLVLEQSAYEPPATIRQAELNLEKAKRSLTQTQTNYNLKRRQLGATMREAELEYSKRAATLEELRNLVALFTIRATKSGMVIYYKDWNGTKRVVGSRVSPWDPAIATLPDLSRMLSKTYVSEVDVSKVRTGQKVDISVDAFPERKYQGKVTQVANVGEVLQGADSKVFEVRIRLNEVDSLIRPSMTTSNRIAISYRDTTIFCPLESLHVLEGKQFVYTASGERRQVRVGMSNETHVEIIAGIAPREKLYLSVPAKGDRFKWVDLPPDQAAAAAAEAAAPKDTVKAPEPPLEKKRGEGKRGNRARANASPTNG